MRPVTSIAERQLSTRFQITVIGRSLRLLGLLVPMLALSFSSIAAGSAETAIVLEDFKAETRYQVMLGGEFPGAKATLSWVAKGRESEGALCIQYDFREGGQYCQWQ